MCLAQGHNAVTPVTLEPVAPRSRVNLYIDPLKAYTCAVIQRGLFHTFVVAPATQCSGETVRRRIP